MQTCVEEVENAEYAAPLKPLISVRGEEPLDEELDPESRLREYADFVCELPQVCLCCRRPSETVE